VNNNGRIKARSKTAFETARLEKGKGGDIRIIAIFGEGPLSSRKGKGFGNQGGVLPARAVRWGEKKIQNRRKEPNGPKDTAGK